MGQRNSVLPLTDDGNVLNNLNNPSSSNNNNNNNPSSTSNNNNNNHINHSRLSQDIPKDEFPHFGVVSVQLSWLTANVRYTPEQQNDITVTGKGAIFYGSNTSSPEIMSELHQHKLYPREISLLDSRAHQLLVTYSNGWYAISSPEIFSRHSGTCIIIGDRANPGGPYKIQLGDCFRLGSVGVVVSEIKNDKGVERKLDNKRLQYLREEALAFESDQDEAALAAEEEEYMKKKQKSSTLIQGSGNGPNSNEENTSYNFQEGSSPFFCYMCYETHDTPEDHLVAPCECKGDTRYLHVQCLQKWYQSSVCGSQAHVIRTTSNGAPACKICGAAYKTAFRNNGVKTSLLEVDHPGPYISLVVVTRHDTSPGLFNTKFRLNFGPNTSRPDEDGPSELSIGRSSLCNMVLDYRTVSTVHAKLIYKNGEFFVQDTHSSNGTMVYLQGPLPLVNNQTVRLRMGRSTLALQAKRSISASIRGTLQRAPLTTPCTASLPELQHIMSLAPPYIPRSIRQVDQSTTEPNMSDMPLPSSSIQTNTDNRFRIQDVNSWLNSIQQNQSPNEFHANPVEESGLNGQGVSEEQVQQELLLPSDHPQLNSPFEEQNRAIEQSRIEVISDESKEINENLNSIQNIDDLSTINQESKSERSPRVTIEYSSSPLPVEILSGGDPHPIDVPIVLGGDRVSVGSRPSSARPASAKKVMISSDPISPSLLNPTVLYSGNRTFSPREPENTSVSNQNSTTSNFPVAINQNYEAIQTFTEEHGDENESECAQLKESSLNKIEQQVEEEEQQKEKQQEKERDDHVGNEQKENEQEKQEINIVQSLEILSTNIQTVDT